MGDRFKLLHFVFIVTLLTLISLPFLNAELDASEKAYFDAQNQKTLAQINSKIDSQLTRIEQNVNNKFEESRNLVIDEVNKNVSNSLKAVAVGLAGLIIITLAMFKIIDMKLNSTNAMKKYENELKTKIEQANQFLKTAQLERQELETARKQLIQYQDKLGGWERNLRNNTSKQQVTNDVQQQTPQVKSYIPYPPQKKGFFQNISLWKKGLVFIVALIIIAGLGFAFYKFIIIG